ncbi:M28 family peptidase [Hymenobacter sp. B1770]|uniref:M28 family peptidase n=1 Tax=Hymenobacter sp. B1770 TaxID=1718788 RepID=UPI003CE9B000
MNKLSSFTAVLLLAAGTVAAQAPTPSKVKIKTKKGRQTEAAPVLVPAVATDWSLPYAATITVEGLKKDLDILASDEYEGRETGKKGQKMAADYLAKAFAEYGLTGPVPSSDNAYLQHFDMNRSLLDAGASTVKVGGKTYQANKDFYPFLADDTFAAPTAVKPVFIGYGIKDDKYSDFTSAADYRGKDVVLLLGEPLDAKGKAMLGADGKPSRYASMDIGALTARQASIIPMGARSVTMILPTAEAFAKVPTGFAAVLNGEQLTFVGKKKRPGLNFVLASPEYGAKLLGTTPAGLEQYRKAVAKAGKAIPFTFKPAAATVQMVMKDEVFTTENVLGYLEGTDKKDEVLVVSAHYDHLGVKNGVVFNGADDDGSGTVSVLAMARAFAQAKKDGHGPRRSILFLANTGEEEGLLGSQYYTENPIFPIANTVTNIKI